MYLIFIKYKMIRDIIFYDDCDVYRCQERSEYIPNELKFGVHKDALFGEVLDIAIKHRCNIIVKNSTGKWYLKYTKVDYESTKRDIENSVGLYPNRKCWLISYL